MKNLKTTLVIGMLFLFVKSFGQVTALKPEKVTIESKTAHTYLDLIVNVVSTNINYGGSNKSLSDYKKSANGIQAGISFQAGITPAFSLVSEFYYIRKGGGLKANNPLNAHETAFHMNTLELPVLTRFHMGRFYINAGPYVAYNLSGKSKINNKSDDFSFNNSNEGFKRIEAGIQMGGGFEFPLKQRRVGIDLRYVYGLTNISYDNEMYNRALMISVHVSKPWKTNPLARN